MTNREVDQSLFLQWAARERGLAWQFKDAATARRAAAVVCVDRS